MKKILIGGIVALSMVGCLSMFACSSSNKTSDAGSGEPAQQVQQEPAKKESKYAVSIDDCTVTSDYSGKPTIVVTYTFTNNSDKAVPFFTAISAKAFQNGVELDTGVVKDIDVQSTLNEIKSGATTTVQQAYVLDDQTEVLVECSELISLDDTIIAEKKFAVA